MNRKMITGINSEDRIIKSYGKVGNGEIAYDMMRGRCSSFRVDIRGNDPQAAEDFLKSHQSKA